MPTQLQIRRGSTTDHNSFTGAAGELTVDTTKDTLRVHDGSTAGGFELARADGSNLNNITSNVIFNASVGIGTSSPSNALTVVDSTSYGQLRLSSSDADATIKYSALSFGQYAAAEEGYAGILGFSNSTENRIAIGGSTGLLNAATAIQFFTAASTTTTTGSEAMRITSGGHLLVGKTTQDSTNTVGFEAKDDGVAIATTDGAQSLILNRKTSDGAIADFRKNNTTVGSIDTFAGDMLIGLGDHKLRFFDSSSAISPCVDGGTVNDGTIDLGVSNSRFKDLRLSGTSYSNTVLVGKTTTGNNNIGTQLSGDGFASIVTTSTNIPFYLENKAVGGNCRISLKNNDHGGCSLGLNNGGDFTLFDSTAATTRFIVTDDKILTATGGLAGIELGGTGAANRLDDYEEGTWTPTLIGSTSGSATIGTVSSASYTKIGNLVHARVYCSSVDLTNGTISGSVRIGGFPFSAVSFSGRLNVHYSDLFTASPVTTGISGYASGTSFILRQGSSQVPFTDSDLSNTTNAAFMVDITYATSA